MKPLALVYMTFPDTETAQRICTALVDNGMVACVNILPQCTSIYTFQGSTRTESEIVAIAKTQTSQIDMVTAKVVAMHPYEVPCVVSIPLERGNKMFMNWISDSTDEL